MSGCGCKTSGEACKCTNCQCVGKPQPTYSGGCGCRSKGTKCTCGSNCQCANAQLTTSKSNDCCGKNQSTTNNSNNCCGKSQRTQSCGNHGCACGSACKCEPGKCKCASGNL